MSSTDPATGPDVLALRPFVPAKDFERCVSYVEEHAGNFMMQLLVENIEPWWERIAALDLATRYGVRPPTAPAVQPWGLKVSYVVDPTGVLWHIAESRKP